jgi:hypothetical protein
LRGVVKFWWINKRSSARQEEMVNGLTAFDMMLVCCGGGPTRSIDHRVSQGTWRRRGAPALVEE